MAKLRVGIISSSILLKTGFSTNLRVLLPYLYKTDKYELFHLNQSIHNSEPNLQRFPWHNQGALWPGTFDEKRFHSDPGYQRFVSYGNAAVEKFVIDNKLDALIHIEDGWSSDEGAYLNSKWFPFIKNNFLQWTTIDSLPILPLYRNYAEKCSNMWVWASFAEKDLKRLDSNKYNHVQTVYGSLDVNEFFPISSNQKKELKTKFNIPEDTKIFIQLGRNQLRKLYPATMEAFSKFKKRHPEHKAKLLFHCSFSEQMGWPFERLIKDFGLESTDLLTTYYCRACNQWEIKPFSGENIGCRFCGAKDTQLTAGVMSSITNEELSQIYGIADASISAFTSGGMEYTNPQSLLCGLPLLCSDYSSGEDFTSQDFVFKLDGTYTYEVQSGFKKHVPNQNTMIKFFKTICEMSEEKRQKIGQQGREWALKTFDVNVIGKKLENWLDGLKPHGWDFTYKSDIKNPMAVVPNNLPDGEWIKLLYKRVLNMDVDEKDSGYISWMAGLQAGQSRHDIEAYFRQTASRENNLNPQATNQFESLLDNTGRKRVLIVLKESIGDILMSTALLESFAKSYEGYDLYYATEQKYWEILEGNPYIYKLLPYIPEMESEIWATGQSENKGYFDSYCFLGAPTQRFLNYLTNDKIALELK